jgi:choline monooxygenase
MSDLSHALNSLQRSHSQLPVSVYFDQALHQTELERIFQCGPRYLGHALSIPDVGNHYALAQEQEGRVLVRSKDGIELMSNVCRHRQALMLNGRGSSQQNHIVCPLHRWTYNLQGELIGAPHFEQDPCLNLKRYPVRNWNGLLFEDNGRDIAQDLSGLAPRFAPGGDLDFSGFVLDKVELHECNYNWKTFIEVYLEDYHVGPFHPGLGNFVTCDDLRWDMAKEYSIQTVGVSSSFDRPGSPVYQAWHDVVMRYRNGQKPTQGAVWLTYYPTLMIEWYPHVLVVSNLYPQGPNKTLNVVEFYYPEEIAAFERDFIEAHQAAYMETCVEDDEIAERMDAGRLALFKRGDCEVGPYQSPMEDGMQHFHEWYRRTMDFKG